MIRVLRGDPTRVQAEAVIRSVGSDLEACTPVGRSVGMAAGEQVLQRLQGFGDVPVGGALVTPGGDLPASLLIHVVVRSSDEPVSEGSVQRALENGLRQAVEWEVGHLALPPLGIGAGNLDAEASARVMCAVLSRHVDTFPFPRDVVLVAANPYEEEAFRSELERWGWAVGPASSRPSSEEAT